MSDLAPLYDPSLVTGVSERTFDALPPVKLTHDAGLGGKSSVHALATPADIARQLGAAKRLVIVVNDLAPRAHICDWKALFQATVGRAVEIIEVHVNNFDGARAAAAGAAAWGVDVVVAVGGDGTVNACVNGVGSSHTRIAVVPAGTANDLARQVGQKLDPARDAISMGNWERRDIDAIKVNDLQFYSVGGVGWVAQTAALANRWRANSFLARRLLARLGSLIYNLACLFVILFSRRLGAKYTITYTDADDGQDKTTQLDGYGMLIANFSRVGRSFQLAPQSDPGDGVFEMILIPRTTRWRLLQTVIAATRGKLFERIDEVRLLRVERAYIEADELMDFFGDGETLASQQRKLALEMAETPVRLMAPVVPARAHTFDPALDAVSGAFAPL